MAKKYPNLGKVLRRLLFERGIKPADLSREVNIPPPTIHRIVTGKSTRPYKSSLQPIADFFSITVDQLLGEENLPETIWQHKAENLPIESNVVKSISIINWTQLDNLATAISSSQKKVVTLGNLSSMSFAVIMPDSSMEPLFSRGTLLIFDPEQTAKDRSYVLAKLHENDLYLFRQLLIDGEDYYLKPLNPDLSMFKMRLLKNKEDQIIARLVESRNQYLVDDQLKLLEDI